MPGARHIHAPHLPPMGGAKFIAARQMEDGMHPGTSGGQTRRVQQIAGDDLHMVAKQPAGLAGMAAKDPQAGAVFLQGANTVVADKAGCAGDQRQTGMGGFSICHGKLFTN